MKKKCKYIDKKIIYEMYIEKSMSVSDIAKELNCGTSNIYNKIEAYSLLKNSKSKHFLALTKEHINKLYNEDCMSVKQIANKYDICITLVNKFLSKNNIKKIRAIDSINEMVGKRFGKIVVTSVSNRNKRSLNCVCDCGRTKIIDLYALLNKKLDGCGSCGVVNGYEDIHDRYITKLISSAKRRGIYYNLDTKYLWDLYVEQNKKCALSEISIEFEQEYSRFKLQTASLDRIDSSQGYTKDNVQWVHKRINFMKQNNTDEYFIELCKAVANFNRESVVLIET